MFDKPEPERTEITAELAALERQLAALTPAAPRLDRDRLMFEAGRAAGSRPRWPVYIAGPSWAGSRFWLAATATMTAAALLLATMVVWQSHSLQIASQVNPPPIIATPAIDQSHEAETTPRMSLSTTGWPMLRQPASGYLGMRYIALTRGVGAIEPSFPSAGGDRDSSTDLQRTQRDMLNELLPSTTRATNPRS